MEKSFKTVIGMMSGTSLDGIDACLVKIFDDFEFEIIASHSLDYPKEIAEKLLECANGNGNVKDVCFLDFAVGKLFAKCANELIEKNGIKKESVDFIASHGQTIYHIPRELKLGEVETRSTLQIGNISVISEITGITTVGDFRSKDIAAGGQGAPLVPFADELIFKKDTSRAIQNIGGIGNVTVLSKDCETFAFDTGAGNMLIDYFTKKFFNLPYDKDGEIAAKGNVNEELLQELLKEPYYSQKPPKSTGRELFNEDYAQKILENSQDLEPQDIIATVTALTAKTIANAYRDFVFPKSRIEEVVIGGGGAYNKTLLRLLAEELKGIKIKTHADFNINDKLKECLAFAILGYCTINKKPNNLPSCTGAKKNVIMGLVSYQ